MDSKRVLFFSMIICYAGFGVINPIMAPLVREIGLDEQQAGWIISIAAFVLLVSAPIWGRLSDRVGRKKVLLTGFIGFSIGLMIFGSVSWFGMENDVNVMVIFILIMVSRVLFGFFFPAMTSSAQALMADFTDVKERSAGMGMLGAATGIGFIIGPAMGALLSGIHLVIPIFVASALVLCVAWFSYKRLPNVTHQRSNKKTKIDLKRVGLRPYLLICTCVMSIFATLQIVGGFYIQDVFQLGAKETAIWLGIGLLSVGIMMALVQMTIIQKRSYPPLTLLRIGLPLFIAALLVLLFTNHLALYLISYMLVGVASGFTIPGYTAGISLAAGEEVQGEAGGLTAAASGIASLIVPVVSTSLYVVNQSLPFWIALGIVVLLLLYVCFGHKSLVFQQVEKSVVE